MGFLQPHRGLKRKRGHQMASKPQFVIASARFKQSPMDASASLVRASKRIFTGSSQATPRCCKGRAQRSCRCYETPPLYPHSFLLHTHKIGRPSVSNCDTRRQDIWEGVGERRLALAKPHSKASHPMGGASYLGTRINNDQRRAGEISRDGECIGKGTSIGYRQCSPPPPLG